MGEPGEYMYALKKRQEEVEEQGMRAAQQRAYHEKMKSDVMRGMYGTTIIKPAGHGVVREQEKEKSCIWSNVKYIGRLLLFTAKRIYA